MADPKRVELDDILNRPGTYFNPQTEVLVIIDDSQAIDAEIFGEDEFEGAEWVLISDEVPLDEDRRDELIEAFAVQYHPDALSHDEDDEDEEDELEPDELEDDE